MNNLVFLKTLLHQEAASHVKEPSQVELCQEMGKALNSPTQTSCTYYDHCLGSGALKFPCEGAKPLAIHLHVFLVLVTTGAKRPSGVYFPDTLAGCHGAPPRPSCLE